VLLEVVIATDLWVLQLVQDLLSILAYWVHNIGHELVLVSEDLM
jgi:hypothetical protein